MNEVEKFVYLISYAPQELPREKVMERVRQQAEKLIELVRDELEKEYVVIEKEAYKSVLKKFSEQGRSAVLRELPKWRAAKRDVFSDTIDFAVKFMNDGGDHEDYETVVATNRLSAGEEYIDISDLIHLQKEE